MIAVTAIIAIILMLIPNRIFLDKEPSNIKGMEQASKGLLGKTCPGAQRRITAEC